MVKGHPPDDGNGFVDTHVISVEVAKEAATLLSKIKKTSRFGVKSPCKPAEKLVATTTMTVIKTPSYVQPANIKGVRKMSDLADKPSFFGKSKLVTGIALAFLALAVNTGMTFIDNWSRRETAITDAMRASIPVTPQQKPPMATLAMLQTVPQQVIAITNAVPCGTLEEKDRNLASSRINVIADGQSVRMGAGCALVQVSGMVKSIQMTNANIEATPSQGFMSCGTYPGAHYPATECATLMNTYSNQTFTLLVNNGGSIVLKTGN